MPDIYPTNIYSTLIILQKLVIRLLTKNITVTDFTEFVIWGIQNGDPRFYNTPKLQGTLSPKKQFFIFFPNSIPLLIVENMCQN